MPRTMEKSPPFLGVEITGHDDKNQGGDGRGADALDGTGHEHPGIRIAEEESNEGTEVIEGDPDENEELGAVKVGKFAVNEGADAEKDHETGHHPTHSGGSEGELL